MIGETTYKITVSRADSDVIKNLVDILENCPMGLNNDDYVEIMKTIAYHNYETDFFTFLIFPFLVECVIIGLIMDALKPQSTR